MIIQLIQLDIDKILFRYIMYSWGRGEREKRNARAKTRNLIKLEIWWNGRHWRLKISC